MENVIHLRPVGWNGMTPRQWGTVRELIRLVRKTALRRHDMLLLLQAQHFLAKTEGYDV